MAYQKKYYYQFIDITNRVHVVELWQNTGATITAEEVTGHLNPFSLEMPELDHKFQVVRGKGCTINLLSDTDMKFFTGLYHIDPQEFMVKHYIDSVLNWLGYLNSEMVTEPYDINFNYQFSITGNDGFSLMDRFSFIQLDGTNYTGIKSKYELLQIIFGKIALPFVEMRISLSTTFTGYVNDADSTILHQSYVNCANFYDEDNKPMSLREVVESILAPYGAFITVESGNIYITDIHTLASDSTPTFKRFLVSDWSYIADVTISNEKAIATIGYMGTGQNIELSGGVNRQVVAYSPFPVKTVIPQSLVSLEEFETVPSSFSTKDGYNYRELETNETWEINPIYDVVLNPPTFEESYYTDPNDSNLYLRYPAYGGLNTMIANLKINPILSVANPTTNLVVLKGASLLITGEVLVKTRDNPYDETESQLEVQNVGISARVKIGDEYYNGFTEWADTPTNLSFYTSTGKNEIIADRFVPIGVNGQGVRILIGNILEIFPLGGDTVGEFDLEIWSEYTARVYNQSGDITNLSGVKEIWLRNIEVTIVDQNGNEIPDSDIEYIGLLDKTFQNEAEKITLTCGANAQFADRGKIMWNDSEGYHTSFLWTRNGQSDTIESLLLVSLVSNYKAGFVTLSGMKLKNVFNTLNILTDSFISGKKMMIKSANINYQDNIIECSLVEILADQLTIVNQ